MSLLYLIYQSTLINQVILFTRKKFIATNDRRWSNSGVFISSKPIWKWIVLHTSSHAHKLNFPQVPI